MSIKSRITLFFALMMLVIEALVLTFIMIINGNVVTNDPEHRLVQVMESNLNRVTFTDQEFKFDKVKYYTKGVYSALYDEEQSIVRAQVADVFCAIFAQELLPARKGGRVPLVEVLLREPSVCSLIRQGKYSQIEMAMMTHQAQGMQTRRQALQKLLQQGLIAREVYERAANRLG